jgi:hypothetical protein
VGRNQRPVGATLGPPDAREHPQIWAVTGSPSPHHKAKSAISRNRPRLPQRTHNPSVGGSIPPRPIGKSLHRLDIRQRGETSVDGRGDHRRGAPEPALTQRAAQAGRSRRLWANETNHCELPRDLRRSRPRRGVEALVRECEEGAPGGRGDRIVPGEGRTALDAGTSDLDYGDVGSIRG